MLQPTSGVALLLLLLLRPSSTELCSSKKQIPCACSSSDTKIGPFASSVLIDHRLTSSSLQNCSKLQHLNLRDLNISTVQDSAFHELRELVWLNLNGNLFVTLPKEKNSPLVQLQTLHVANTNLNSTDMNLSGLHKLEYLDLSDNVFRRSPEHIAALPQLRQLNLLGNYIDQIDANTFAGMPELQVMNLNYNRLQHLNSHTFDGLKSLTHLSLVGNLIFYIDFDTFTPLQSLKVY